MNEIKVWNYCIMNGIGNYTTLVKVMIIIDGVKAPAFIIQYNCHAEELLDT